MKRDEIRLVQSVLAANRPDRRAVKERVLWERIRDDMAKSIRMSNPLFNHTLYMEGCEGIARKPETINHDEIKRTRSTRKPG